MTKLREATHWVRKQPPPQIVTTAAALVIAVAALVAIALEVGEEEEDAAAVGLPQQAVDQPEPDEESAAPEEDSDLVVPTFQPVSDSNITRVAILSAVVDTEKIGTLELIEGGLAPPPDESTIFYYGFSALPGDPAGNAILSGSVVRTAEAEGILANLAGVGEGDQILIELEDGTQYVYRVFAVRFLPAETTSVTPADVGCTDEQCAGFGTLAIVGFEEASARIVVQAQVVPGGS